MPHIVVCRRCFERGWVLGESSSHMKSLKPDLAIKTLFSWLLFRGEYLNGSIVNGYTHWQEFILCKLR